MAVEPPRERAEPEDRAMQQGKTLRQSVTARNMRHLVCNYRVKLRVVPLPPGSGQQNRGAKCAHRNWDRNQLGFSNSRYGGEPTRIRPGGKSLGESRLVYF